jgi:hypothetical protein
LAAWTDADTGAGLPTNGVTPAGNTIYEFDGTPMTLTEDLNLNGCVIKFMGAVLQVKSTATSTPVLTLSNGGKLVVGTVLCSYWFTEGCFLNISSNTRHPRWNT